MGLPPRYCGLTLLLTRDTLVWNWNTELGNKKKLLFVSGTMIITGKGYLFAFAMVKHLETHLVACHEDNEELHCVFSFMMAPFYRWHLEYYTCSLQSLINEGCISSLQ